MTRMRPLALPFAASLLLAGVLLVACGDGGDRTTGRKATSTTTGRGAVSTPLNVEATKDLRYHQDIPGLHPPTLDVFAPTEGGPWPVIVMFHGGAGMTMDRANMAPTAELVAAEGAVVFNATTGGPAADLESPDPAIMTGQLAEAACATAFASEHAEDYGGDPHDINLHGYSGGAQVSAPLVWGGARVDEGCVAHGPPPRPRTAVFFEGDWFIAPSWDDALETGAITYDDIAIWDDLGEASDTEVVLVVGTETGNSPMHRTPVGDVWSATDCGSEGAGWVPRGGTCRWLQLRDPDGQLRRDMERLGQLDDGFIDVSENSLLLADRLERAGHPATLVTINGLSHGTPPAERAELLAPVIIEHSLR